MRDLAASFPRPCGERWEAMTPVGRDRACATCDTIVHDLSAYTFDEAQDLLNNDPPRCVQARVGADGVVALKPGSRNDLRRIVVAIGASASLLAAGEPAFAASKHVAGSITGTIKTFDWNTRVIATATDGTAYRTRVKQNGTYRLKRLPAGSYTLTFAPACGDSWTIDAVVVEADTANVLNATDPNECIVVGALRIESDAG